MGDIKPFDFEGNLVRIETTEDELRFILTDACKVIGVANASRAASRLDEDERGITTMNTPSGPQELIYVTESGFYSLVLTSRKPAAKRFKKWVTSEVLPSIRRTGGYGAPAAIAGPSAQGEAALLTGRDVPYDPVATQRFATIAIASDPLPTGRMIRTNLQVFEAADANVAMGLAAIRMNRLWPALTIECLNAIPIDD
jgi:prophage antirepressor-like protein